LVAELFADFALHLRNFGDAAGSLVGVEKLCPGNDLPQAMAKGTFSSGNSTGYPNGRHDSITMAASRRKALRRIKRHASGLQLQREPEKMKIRFSRLSVGDASKRRKQRRRPERLNVLRNTFQTRTEHPA
jgi:hypothetical protein